MQKHTHIWSLMFTQKLNGVVSYSFLRCQECEARKEVKGEWKKESENTWSSNPAKYTK